MKTTYISRAKFGKFTAAIAAAALLAGTAAPGVLAADYTAQLTKTIDMTAAPGAGVPHGSIALTVGTVANLPSWAAGTAVKGTAAQIKSTELTAAFTGGTVNTVTVPFTFDSDDFTAPGDYIFSLTETAAGITGNESASEICDALKAQFATMTVDGLTGSGMHWDENGMISKSPAAVVVENGVYVPMD